MCYKKDHMSYECNVNNEREKKKEKSKQASSPMSTPTKIMKGSDKHGILDTSIKMLTSSMEVCICISTKLSHFIYCLPMLCA